MTPTIVVRDGRVILVTGSPGSRAIPNTVLNVMVSLFDFGIPVQDAVEMGRFTQEWFPDQIGWERMDFHPQTVEGIEENGPHGRTSFPAPLSGRRPYNFGY